MTAAPPREPLLNFETAAKRRDQMRTDRRKGRPPTTCPHAFDARRWIDENPDAMKELARICRQLRDEKGKASVKFAVEQLRWDSPTSINRLGKTFRVPNAYTAEIACELARTCPDLADAITGKRAKAERKRADGGAA